jgi:hypothetical protein
VSKRTFVYLIVANVLLHLLAFEDRICFAHVPTILLHALKSAFFSACVASLAINPRLAHAHVFALHGAITHSHFALRFEARFPTAFWVRFSLTWRRRPQPLSLHSLLTFIFFSHEAATICVSFCRHFFFSAPLEGQL